MSNELAALALISTIEEKLTQLRGLLQVQPEDNEFDPKDPRNKMPDGKLTPRGVEICYRLFDQGKTRYAVSDAMNISFAAATHRFQAWETAGGPNREKAFLESL